LLHSSKKQSITHIKKIRLAKKDEGKLEKGTKFNLIFKGNPTKSVKGRTMNKNNMSSKQVIIFGSSYMAEEYLKVLKHLGTKVSVVSRNKKNANALAEKYGYKGYGESTEALKNFTPQDTDLIIIASAIPSLKEITIACIEKGFKNILVEKPGAVDYKEIKEIKKKMTQKTTLRYAFNRRFFSSVKQLHTITQEEKITGCFFDFTERQKDVINNTRETKEVMARWGLANSIHVIDLAFYLIGKPKKMTSQTYGSWQVHPTGNIFTGCGETSKCPFSYFSSWNGAGRWDVEITTNKGRYKLSPLEELQFCEKDQFGWTKLALPTEDHPELKPGLLEITTKALENLAFANNLPDIDELAEIFKITNKICGYENDEQ
jgi:predicted dehydrogenase